MVLVDDRGVLDQRLERLDPAFDERLLVLGVLVLGVLGQVAVFLGVVDPIGDLGPLDRDHLVELGAELLEAFLGEVGGLAVHGLEAPARCWFRCGLTGLAVFDKGKNSRRLAADAARLKFRPGANGSRAPDACQRRRRARVHLASPDAPSVSRIAGA